MLPPASESGLHLCLLILQAPSIYLTPFSQGSKHRQLLATLRALEAASLPQQYPSLPDSDSEEDVVERKKKRLKKASSAGASVDVEKKRKKKCQKQGPPGSDYEEKEVKGKKKCLRGILNASDPAEEQKRKRKCQKQAPSNPAQHVDKDNKTGTSGFVYVCEMGGGIS